MCCSFVATLYTVYIAFCFDTYSFVLYTLVNEYLLY
jgi:hypothetical protein